MGTLPGGRIVLKVGVQGRLFESTGSALRERSQRSELDAFLTEWRLQLCFVALLLCRLLYPFFNSPLEHLFSDPQRHWQNGANFLHPNILGAADPRLFQAWIFVVRSLSHDDAPKVLLACGILCAGMPYGWYRALRELQPRRRALGCAIVIGLIPESISVYGFFMNETLLITLLGYCFWLTLRARRKENVAAFALATLLWLCAALTRTVALPMAALCLAWLWLTQGQRLNKFLVGAGIACLLIVPAGLHGRDKLHFFAPFGNLYFNEIYHGSGLRDIAVDYGPDGAYRFGSPSFYNATFYPFSPWTTDRRGVAAIKIDLTQGRAAWIDANERLRRSCTFPSWRERLEDAAYLLVGPVWPNSSTGTLMGCLTLWARWLLVPLLVFVSWGLSTRRYRGDAYLLPLCALGMSALLLLQNEGVMEARFREPLDAIVVCAALLVASRRGGTAR
jgi:hypothetical protein